MEGETTSTNRFRFLESKRRFKLEPDQTPTVKHIAMANNHNLLFIIHGQSVLGFSTDQLYDFDRSKKTEIFIANQFSLNFPLSFQPTLLTVARYGFSSTLLVCGINPQNNGVVIEAFDLDTRSSIGRLFANELGINNHIIDYSWHPNYFESIVALCSKEGHLLFLAINKNNKSLSIVSLSNNYGALTCAWSPKGKNLAVGTRNGTIFRLEPVIESNKFSFKEVDKSLINFLPHPKITNEYGVVKLRWLNKTFLICAHAKPGDSPDTVYSIITVKPTKPHSFWTNICLENPNMSNYVVHIVNLTNAAVCTSSMSGEAAVIGVNGFEELNRGEFKNFIIDVEGARVELPLDASNRETYPKGVTTAFLKTQPNDPNPKPILIFYTSDSIICSFLVDQAESIMRLPEFQKPEGCPINTGQSSIPQPQQVAPPPQQQSFQTHSFGSAGLFNKGPSASASFYNPLAGLSSGSSNQATFGTFGSTAPLSTFGSLAGTSSFGASSFNASVNNSLTFSNTPVSAPSNPPASLFSTPALNLSMNSQPAQVSATPVAIPNPVASGPTLTHAPVIKPVQISAPVSQTAPPAPTVTPTPKPAAEPLKPPATPSLAPSITPAPKPPQTVVPSTTSATTTTTSMPALSFSSLSFSPAATFPATPSDSLIGQTKPTQSKQTETKNKPPTKSQEPSQATKESPTTTTTPTTTQISKSADKKKKDMKIIPQEIGRMKESIKYNEAFLTLLEEINHLRKQLKEVEETHTIHTECLDAIKEDISQLDIGMLENLYLIEYIKSRNRDISRKKSLDPKTLKKVESIKQKSKLLADRLKDLNLHVDVSWEDFVRRKSAAEGRDRKINSLDIIYQTLATNQKIIIALQRKVASMNIAPTSLNKKPLASSNLVESLCDSVSNRRELEPAKMRAFKEYLSSRNGVPVRRPDVVVKQRTT